MAVLSSTVLLKILVITVSILTVVLVVYSAYVKISQKRYTDKRFNFVALWACVALTLNTLTILFNVPIWVMLLDQMGVILAPPGPLEKILACVTTIAFYFFVSSWAKHWNGQRVIRSDAEDDTLSSRLFFAVDGLRETERLVKRGEPPKVKEEAQARPVIPEPYGNLEFKYQALELVLGKWTEFEVDEDRWIDSLQGWMGSDVSLDQPVMILCPHTDSDIDLQRIAQHVEALPSSAPCRIIVILEHLENRAKLEEDLASFTAAAEVLSLDELVERVLPLARYRREIAKQFKELHIANSNLSLSEVIVPTFINNMEVNSSGRLIPTGDPLNSDNIIDTWISESSQKQMALLGDYGQGKSTAALALTHRLLNNPSSPNQSPTRIPILMRLTGLSPKTTSPEVLLTSWGARMGLSGRALLALHRAGRTILIFDAFDEMANVSDEADRLDHFAGLWLFACPNAKLLFTGRPNFFLDDEELMRILGVAESETSGPYCKPIQVTPFNRGQIVASLRWMEPKKVDKFMETVGNLEQLSEIVSRPSLLFQVSQLWHHGRFTKSESNLASASIIRKFVSYSLERQVMKQRTDLTDGSPSRKFIPLRQSELDYFTVGCAIAAVRDGRNNSLPTPVFRETITVLLENAVDTKFERSPTETGALSLSLNDRFKDHSDPIESTMQAVRTHGVIEHDLTTRGSYKFSHKSFAEVLAAEASVSRLLHPRSKTSNAGWPLSAMFLLDQDVIFKFALDFVASDPPEPISEFEVFRKLVHTRSHFLAINFFISFQLVANYLRIFGKAFDSVRAIGETKNDIPRAVERLSLYVAGIGIVLSAGFSVATIFSTDVNLASLQIPFAVALGSVGTYAYLRMFSAAFKRIVNPVRLMTLCYAVSAISRGHSPTSTTQTTSVRRSQYRKVLADIFSPDAGTSQL